jgi:hypothetical protein
MIRSVRSSQIALVSLGCLLWCPATSFARLQQAPPVTSAAIKKARIIVLSAPPMKPTPPANQGSVVVSPSPKPILIPELTIGGHTVMRLRATAGGLTPDERAFDLRRRLGPILTLPDLIAADVTVRQERPRQTASIYVRGRLLVTVDRNLAKANNSSIINVATQWANNLKETLPQVNVAVRMFDVSTGN